MEFLLVLPLIVVVLVASLQVVSVVSAKIELLAAVREGARVAATVPDPSRAVEAVRLALDSADRDRVRISVSRPGVVGRPAVVKATMRHRLLGSMFEGLAIDVSASASMYVEG